VPIKKKQDMRYFFNNFCFLSLLLLFISCNQARDPIKIIQNTISSIDTINTIYYQQTQLRGATENIEDVKQKERTFYYGRLKFDSIIGAKAHIYYYDSTYIFLEDIYDGNKLIRKLNRDSSARVYDLLKYPDLKKKPFWGKTTPYVIQYLLKYAIENKERYIFELENDIIINGKNCYCLKTILEKKALMPGFFKYTTDTNRVETMILFIDKLSYYPQRMRMEVYFIDNPGNVYFTDNTFYNIKFNPEFNDSLFITSDEVITGFEINEIKP
jgi:outer membrane lipoprotein-sorting protein